MKTFDQFQEARLTADQRRALPNKDFALPGKGEGPKGKQAGSYPIPDKKHARSALSLVSQHGTPEEKATVRAKVKKKFPDIQQEEVELDERLGGKGYQPYTSLTGKKISGDWEDSDRGAGNKAKKRAGGKVEKKSPTYLAHVHNKEGYESKKTGEVLAAFKRDPKVRKRFEKAAKKEGGPGSAKNRAADDMLQTAKDTAKRKGDTSKSDDRYAYESAVLDANTKIQKKEQRKKDEKEYAKLMAIYNHQKDLKKRGLSNSYEPEGEVIDEGIMKMVKKVIRSKKPAKKATMDATTDKLHDWRQKNSPEQQDREKYVSFTRPIVKEAKAESPTPVLLEALDKVPVLAF